MRLLSSVLVLLLASSPCLAGDRAILVLDASGSMWQEVDGRSKVEIAREAIDTMLGQWNPDVSLGLLAYGHRRRGDCGDIELLIPPDGFDRAAISRTVRNLNALGMTPITAAVRRAAEELRYTEHKATVILVSDGEETCNADPCMLGQELEAQGIDFTAHVIGFDLPEGPAREQLQCLAARTGGGYFDARDASELGAALDRVSRVATASPVAVPSEGCVAFDDTDFAGERLPLGPGRALDNLVGIVDAAGYDWNDRILSLECRPGCTVEAFEHIHFDGARISLEGRLGSLPEGWGMTISSLRVECGTRAPRTEAPAAGEGGDWIDGMTLVPDFDVYLDADAAPAAEAPEFTVEQTARDCQRICMADDRCAAWHYEPAGSYFVDVPRCHTKGFGIGLRLREEGEGFVAGFKPGAKVKASDAND